MKKLVACKNRLRPTAEQRVRLGKFVGHNSFVCNKPLALHKEGCKKGQKPPSGYDRSRLLTS